MKTLFACGDSWTYGSEIVAPEFLSKPGEPGYGMSSRLIKDFTELDKRNDSYRIPRTWPSYLGQLMQVDVVENHGWPARSNDTIAGDTIHWVLKNYITPKRDTSELTVVIGWSSPERKNVIVENFDDTLYEFTVWPAMNESKFYENQVAKKYFEFHVNHLWTEKESLTRFIDQNVMLHYFLKSHGIKHYFFNAFYVPKGGEGFDTWLDAKMVDRIMALNSARIQRWVENHYTPRDHVDRLLMSWASIPEKVFINKETCESFKTFAQKNVPHEKAWCGIHPSPESNEAWARYIFDWIQHDD